MKIFQSIASFLKHFRYGANPNPVRDWLAALAVSTIALATIIVWNLLTFNTIAAGGGIGTAAPVATPVFNRASLDAVRAIFAARASEEAKYVSGGYTYIDPSQ